MKTERNNKMVKCAAIIGLCVMAMLVLPASSQSEETYKFERMWPTLQQPWYFGDVEGIAVDKDGYVYVTDMYSHCIRKFTRDGQLVARWGSYGKEEKQFDTPSQVAIDNENGWLYVIEKYNDRVQKFTLDGEFVKAWGKHGSGDSEFCFPRRIAVDKKGFVYVSDSCNYRIQKFSPDFSPGDKIEKKWGTKGNGDLEFLAPRGIAFDSKGDVYIADAETNFIQKFTPDGDFLLKWCGSSESEGGPFNAPNGIVIDSNDFIYIADEGNDCIQKFDLNDGKPKFIAKWGGEGVSAREKIEKRIKELINDSLEAIQTYRINARALEDLVQYLPGDVGEGKFKGPRDISVDSKGAVYVADTGNQRIQKLDSDGNFVAKWSGIGKNNGAFQSPLGVAVHKSGDEKLIYVADSGNHRIQKFSYNRGIFLDEWGYEGDKEGQFEFPTDVAVGEDGKVYVADALNFRIQKFDAAGNFEFSWGESAISSGKLDFGDKKFVLPVGVTVKDGYVYVADLGGNRIHKFDVNGNRIKWWEAQAPVRVAVDSAGNVYTVNQDCNCVQKFDPSGIRDENWKIELAKDSEITGPAIEYAGLTIEYDPADGKEYLYVSTGEYNFCIWKFLLENDKASFVTQISEPGPEIGQVIFPAGIDVDEDGRVYVADTGNHRVQVFRKGPDSDKKMKAIIVAGRKSLSDKLWKNKITQTAANFAYRALIYNGFTADSVYYLSSDMKVDLNGDGETDVDALATKQNLNNAIQWAKSDPATQDVLLYLVDHGGEGTFKINENETLYVSGELDGWLNDLQNAISGKLIVVYEACNSGSFLPYLKSQNEKERIVIASASADESAWFFVDGAVSFSNYFWGHILNGSNIEQAFENAKNATKSTIGDQNARMDDDGNGIYEEGVDGKLARNTYIGNAPTVSENAPIITSVSVSPSEILDSETTSAVISAEGVTDEDGIAWVRAVISPPGYTPLDGESVVQLPFIELSQKEGHYEEPYNFFDMSGEYRIAVYAKDNAGNISSPKLCSVTVQKTLRRKAVILVGEPSSDSMKSLLIQFAAYAYNTLKSQLYRDEDIYFMIPDADTSSEGVDGRTNFENLQYALTEWTGDDSQDLVLYMIGEGWSEDNSERYFRLNDTQTLSAGKLNEWLNDLHTRMPGKITVIYDSCDSETFLSLLTPTPEGKERILIGSTGKEQPAYFISEGTISFSKYFWKSISDGASVKEAFRAAEYSIELLDEQNAPQINDKTLAGKYFIGAGIMQAESQTLIGATAPLNQILADSTDSPELWVKPAKAGDSTLTVWAAVKPPTPSEYGSACYITTLGDKKISFVYKAEKDRYEPVSSCKNFFENSEYSISVTVEDGTSSDSVTIEICKGDADRDGIGDCWDPDPYGPNNEWLDSDNDGVPDIKDAFPDNKYEQYDSDGDGIGDNEDQDDDNDGYEDRWEDFFNTSPIDPNDYPPPPPGATPNGCNLSEDGTGSGSVGYSQAMNTSGSGDSAAYTISGQVATSDGLGIPGILIKDNSGLSAITNAQGYYRIKIPAEWTGTLSPSNPDYVFVPSELPYDEVQENFLMQNYRAGTLPDADYYKNYPPTIESVRSGEWNDPNTWNKARAPLEDDVVRINADHTVVFNPSDAVGTDTYIQDACNSGTIDTLKKRNRIKGLCNLGTLKSDSDRDIVLWTSDFIYNNGYIYGQDALASSSIADMAPVLADSGSDGRNITLTAAKIFYNDAEGDIQGGRGGDHYGDFAVGGDGGSVEIYGDKIFNDGKIGPQCDVNTQGGHGGNASTPFGDSTSCTDSFGGNGGDTVLLADTTLINMDNGGIASGKGGNAEYGHCNGYAGKEGDIVFTAQTAIQNGLIEGCGDGTAISCDPPNIYSNGTWKGKDITISGGNCSTIDLSGLDSNAISGTEKITIAVGEGGTVDLRGVKKGAFNGKEVEIYADNILKDDCVTLSELIPNLELYPSKIIYDFTMNTRVNPVKGTTDQFAYIPVSLINNSPEHDGYEIKVTDSRGRELNVIDSYSHSVGVEALKEKTFCLKVRLPDDMGERDRLFVQATSKGNPANSRGEKVIVISTVPPPADPDEDGDGLTNSEEKEIGTDPNKADSDGDGMKDGWEHNYRTYYGLDLDPLDPTDAFEDPDNDAFTNLEEFNAATNPNDPCSKPNSYRAKDSDGDGLKDVVEVKYGTDPNNADTDGDGMDDGWEFYHGLNPFDRTDASDDLDQDGFSNLEEFNEGSDPENPDSVPNYPKDEDNDGLPDVVEKMYEDHPDKADSDGNGVNDLEQAYTEEYPQDSDKDGLPDIIESMYETDPTIADTDGDGMKDGWEVYHGLNPNDKNDASEDPDEDGFTNLEEYKDRSDPNDSTSIPNGYQPKDTDGDKLPDVLEIKYGTDINKADSDEDGMDDPWEVYHNLLNPPNNGPDDDRDDDGFTNLEEFNAGTDPNDPEATPTNPSHAEYPKDTDKDGLPDVAEELYGTDKNKPDSDGDGMTDGWEVYNGFDPLVKNDPSADSDQDGFTDFEEFKAGTDPKDAKSVPEEYLKDTDDDGLTDMVETEICKTDPENADSDGDGMTDSWEVYNELDPTSPHDASADPDNDGYSNLEEFELGTVPHCVTPKAGEFIVGDDGIVEIDWLYDGGGFYRGWLGIFSLRGMESYTDEAFRREAVRRAMSETDQGHIVFSDFTEGARFRGTLTGEPIDWNNGPYKGTKELRMIPRDRIATILIPNATVDELGECMDSSPSCLTGDRNKSPLFSVTTRNSDYGMHIGQVLGIDDMRKGCVIEDIDLNDPECDSDYNDLIIQITGVTVEMPTLASYISPTSPGRQKRDDGGWFDWRTETELGRAIMRHLETPSARSQKRWLSVEVYGSADLFVYDDQGNVIGKEGGDIPGDVQEGRNIAGADFEMKPDGTQTVWLPVSEAVNYRIVLHGTGQTGCMLTVRTHEGSQIVSEKKEAVVGIRVHQTFKADLSVSSATESMSLNLDIPQACGYDFDGDGDIDDLDISRLTRIWNTCAGNQDYDVFYDLDDDGCITVLDIMQVQQGVSLCD